MGKFAEERIQAMVDGHIPVSSVEAPKLDSKDVQRYFEINQQIAKLEKEKKDLNARFKKILGSTKSNYEIDDLVVKVIPQDKSKLDEEEAVRFIKNKIEDKIDELVESGVDKSLATEQARAMFRGVIVTVEKINSEVLEQLFFKGLIIPEEFSKNCVTPNTVLTLRVDKKSKEEETENDS